MSLAVIIERLASLLTEVLEAASALKEVLDAGEAMSIVNCKRCGAPNCLPAEPEDNREGLRPFWPICDA